MGADTRTRLIVWGRGDANSAYLAQGLVRCDGAEDVDPIHPQGGPDGGKDILCTYKGVLCVVAVYFPNNSNTIKYAALKKKFRDDVASACTNKRPGFLFVTNVQVTNAHRGALVKLANDAGLSPCIIFHLERIHALLDYPLGYGLREQYLELPMTDSERIAYDQSTRLQDREEVKKLFQLARVQQNLDMAQLRADMEKIIKEAMSQGEASGETVPT